MRGSDSELASLWPESIGRRCCRWPTLGDCPGGIAHHDIDPPERHIELLGDDLGDRNIELAGIHVLEIGCDFPVRLDVVGVRAGRERAVGFIAA